MGSFTWLSSGSALGRFGSLLQRLRRSMAARRPAVRWGLAALTLVVLVLLGFLGASSLTTAESAYLGSGRRYSPDDLIKIRRVLDRQRFPYQIDDQRRVAVAPEQHELASTAISKLDIGPRPPGEIRDDQSAASSVWESIHDKELREYQGREKILESMIDDLDGIVGSFVWINRPKPRFGLQPVVKPSAFVRLETEADRQLPFRMVQSLTTILTGYEPGLTADAVTVVDRRGHKYLDAGNPALSALSHNRAREEELSQEILEKLDWIDGVRVSVQLPETAVSGLDPVAQGHSERRDTVDSQTLRLVRESKHADPTARPEAPRAIAVEPKVAAPAVAVNRPLTLEPEPPPPPQAATGAPAPGSTSTATPPSEAGRRVLAPSVSRDVSTDPGRVWVRVPRSFYYHVGILPNHKEPSLEEFQKLVARTEEQIKTVIALVVPLSGSSAWKTTIDMIPDKVPLDRPPVVAPPADARRIALDWGIAGAMGAMAAALVTFGSWILSARRPSARPAAPPRGLRFHEGSVLTPGPSERVREFVRRNPESAVSVLERWTSQGGDAS
jgi:flagellar M-ring protein FliF